MSPLFTPLPAAPWQEGAEHSRIFASSACKGGPEELEQDAWSLLAAFVNSFLLRKERTQASSQCYEQEDAGWGDLWREAPCWLWPERVSGESIGAGHSRASPGCSGGHRVVVALGFVCVISPGPLRPGRPSAAQLVGSASKPHLVPCSPSVYAF